MAYHICKWGGDWHSAPWASAKGVWVKLSPQAEEEEARTWEDAACEDGRLLRVLWCELCQLAGDVGSVARPCKPEPPRSI
ncbi:MAG TPA: hypothetical protein VGM51_01345 [Armatimonadota bacterium]